MYIFFHVKQGHRKWCMTVKHGWRTQFTAYTVADTQSRLCSLAFSLIPRTGALLSSYCLAAENEKNKQINIFSRYVMLMQHTHRLFLDMLPL